MPKIKRMRGFCCLKFDYRIGTLYDDGQNTEKALEYYQKSIDCALDINEDENFGFLSGSYANMGLIYSELWNESGDAEYRSKTIFSLQKALEIDTKHNNANGIYTICKH